MFRYHNNPEEDLKRNRPQKLPAIINTVLSGIVVIIIIILKIFTDHVSWYLFFAFMIVLIMFPIASWYAFYFSKKQKTKILKTYDKENELITKYMNHTNKYQVFNKEMNRDIEFNVEDTIDILPNYNYNSELSSFGLPDSNYTLIQVGVGFVSMVVDPNTSEIINLCGLLAKSIFIPRRLKFNKESSLKKKIYIKPINFDLSNKLIYQSLMYADTYYDKKTGMVCIGERKIYPIDDIYEFMNGAYLVLRDNKIVSLWIEIDKGIELY